MTRKECMERRAQGINYLRAQGKIVSSEEAVDTLIPYMELVHHAPYPDVYKESDNCGITLPLNNLVYHDCLITPWTLHDTSGGMFDEDTRFLQALLNGGPAYLDIEASDEEMERVQIIADLQKKVANREMLSHSFLSADRTKQQTRFEGGVVVTVDFTEKTYSIQEEK